MIFERQDERFSRTGSKKIFKIYAGSTELSPFHECYATNDTVLRSADGSIYYAYVRDFDGNKLCAYCADET